MARDPNVFILGEEVAAFNGAYKISKNMAEKYGSKRVIDTPITEHGFAGLAVGAAFYGLRPICEFMSFNFSLQACDHIVNSAAKLHYMSGGKLKCPITFRGCNGPPLATAATHSQCLASWYAHIPGLLVVSPYDTEDARGLFKACVRDDNPTVCLENEILYGDSYEVSDQVLDKDFVIPFGKARLMTTGKDVTLVSYSKGLRQAIKAAEELAKVGIQLEVINLRSIRPLDIETIVKSVKKTGRLVTLDESFLQSGVGAEICTQIMESTAFDSLKCRVQRIACADVPMPYAKNLEQLALPRVDNIVKLVKSSFSLN